MGLMLESKADAKKSRGKRLMRKLQAGTKTKPKAKKPKRLREIKIERRHEDFDIVKGGKGGKGKKRSRKA